jgi:hypothetical protein
MTIKYPSIEQFKSVIKEVTNITRYAGKDDDGKAIYNNDILPTITFKGTVKIHGTNGGIRVTKDGKVVAQSRERDLSLVSDNNGFCQFVLKNETVFRELALSLIDDNDAVVIYGEWFGKGINSNVAVNELDKRFAIFGIRFIKDEMENWIDTDALVTVLPDLSEYSIYNIAQFATWTIDIDFNRPEAVQNKLIEITEAIDKECPIGKHFGVTGHGEGAVYSAIHNGHFLQFKVKGESHSNSKIKKLAPVDEEAFNNAREFAENFTTEARLQQGLFVMQNELCLELVPQNTGKFIQWVVSDIMKEESSNIAANDLDVKKIISIISNTARVWYFKNI